MTALVFTAAAVALVAAVLLLALTHHRQENTMAQHRHRPGLSAPTAETVDLMLAQLARDRARSSYWQSEDRADQLDCAEVWLLSLRDWLTSGRGAR